MGAGALRAKATASALVPNTEVSFALGQVRPPFVGGERTLALAQRAQAIYAELGQRLLNLVPGTGGGTDAGFANRSGKPAVLKNLGLAGWGYHAKDEYIEIDSIVPRLYLSTRLLMDLARDRAAGPRRQVHPKPLPRFRPLEFGADQWAPFVGYMVRRGYGLNPLEFGADQWAWNRVAEAGAVPS